PSMMLMSEAGTIGPKIAMQSNVPFFHKREGSAQLLNKVVELIGAPASSTGPAAEELQSKVTKAREEVKRLQYEIGIVTTDMNVAWERWTPWWRPRDVWNGFIVTASNAPAPKSDPESREKALAAFHEARGKHETLTAQLIS